jgi:hypothetical protein
LDYSFKRSKGKISNARNMARIKMLAIPSENRYKILLKTIINVNDLSLIGL